jgi:hypothetical protein
MYMNGIKYRAKGQRKRRGGIQKSEACGETPQGTRETQVLP